MNETFLSDFILQTSLFTIPGFSGNAVVEKVYPESAF
jgi:hypothetical protein